MDNPKDEEVKQWLIKSHRDLKVAIALLNLQESLLDAVVFHCQQSAEKALKAFLAYQDFSIKKTHDLSVLTTFCISFDSTFVEIEDFADILTPYAPEFRYPGDAIEPELSEAEEAIMIAEKIFCFVVQRLPPSISNTLIL